MEVTISECVTAETLTAEKMIERIDESGLKLILSNNMPSTAGYFPNIIIAYALSAVQYPPQEERNFGSTAIGTHKKRVRKIAEEQILELYESPELGWKELCKKYGVVGLDLLTTPMSAVAAKITGDAFHDGFHFEDTQKKSQYLPVIEKLVYEGRILIGEREKILERVSKASAQHEKKDYFLGLSIKDEKISICGICGEEYSGGGIIGLHYAPKSEDLPPRLIIITPQNIVLKVQMQEGINDEAKRSCEGDWACNKIDSLLSYLKQQGMPAPATAMYCSFSVIHGMDMHSTDLFAASVLDLLLNKLSNGKYFNTP